VSFIQGIRDETAYLAAPVGLEFLRELGIERAMNTHEYERSSALLWVS